MSEFDGGDWIHNDGDILDESGEKEKEEMVFNPTSVRDRIDVSFVRHICGHLIAILYFI